MDNLQKDLNSIQDRANEWMLKLHQKEWKTMHVSGRRNPENLAERTYRLRTTKADTLDYHILKYTQEEKDPGVIVDNIKFEGHI